MIIAAANLCASVHWLVLMRRAFLPNVRRAIVDYRRNWRLSRYIFLSSMLWTAGTYLYVWMVSLIVGNVGAGIWTACFQLASLANPLMTAVQNMMGPAISHAFVGSSMASFRQYVLKCTLVSAGIGGASGLVLAALSEYLIVLFNGVEYAGSGRITAVLAITLLLQGTSFPTSRGLYSLDRAKLDMYANAGPLVAMVVLGFVLIQHFSVMGAAVCFVIAQLSATLCRLFFFLQVSKAESPSNLSIPEKSGAVV
jgi:O-antigen/teichoic acid export membrane protein